MPSRKPKAKKKWSMFPSLDDGVSDLLEEYGLYFGFHQADDAQGCIEEKNTHIMGRFICHNRACKANGWSSKKIAITIRMYLGDEYNARVYHQRCKSCETLSRPLLDDSYADRVAYRLKVWSGIRMERRKYGGKESKGPHNSHLCEGCKAGVCEDNARSDSGKRQ
ncbi:hypothetical protein FQN49_007759, partial [Arthroderma sp. PD_2]